MLTIVVEGDPQGKARPKFVRRTNGSVGTYTPYKTQVYEQAIGYSAKHEMQGHPPYQSAMGVDIEAECEVPKSWSQRKRCLAFRGLILPHSSRYDIDNIAKAALDGLNGIVWIDDKQVVDVRARKYYSATPRLTIRVREVLDVGGLE